MTIIPAGSPYWTRSAVLGDYGGHTSKENELSLEARQLRTDFDAAMLMRLADDMLSCSRTSPFGFIVYTTRDATLEDPIVECAFLGSAQAPLGWDNGGDPPTGFPALTYSAAGRTHITFNGTYTDAFDVDGTFWIRRAHGDVLDENAAAYCVTTKLFSANLLNVYATVVATGAAATDKTFWVGF